MKKLSLFLLLCLPLLAQAQTYDTISGRDGKYYKYYYSTWFDSCDFYRDTVTRYSVGHPEVPGSSYLNCFGYSEWARSTILPGGTPPPPMTPAKTEYVPRPSALKGVAVVTSDKFGQPYQWMDIHPVTEATSDTLAPDTCIVFTVTNGEMDILGAARWDTAVPKIYKIPWHEDSLHAGFACLEVFEVYFKTPFMVNDTFFITGTPYNTECASTGYYLHPPHFYTEYSAIVQLSDPCNLTREERDNYPWGWMVTWGGDKPIVQRSKYGRTAWGVFLPIFSYDLVYLNVRSADSTMGSVSPRPGNVLQWIEHTITAVPKTGYRFTHWNDGSTENPRRVLMTRDSSFTAYFEPKPLYNVTVEAIPPEWGHVEGGGTYYDGDTVTLEAIPDSNAYYFSHWQDYQQENPLSFIVTNDTLFTAHFTDENGISAPVTTPAPLFTLTPNPTTGEVTVTLGHSTYQPPLTPPEGGERLTLTIHDAAGNEVLHKELVRPGISISLDLSDLPSGAYFVTLVTPTASGTQKLVVK